MRPDAVREFAWSQQWVPQLQRFLGPHLLREATQEEDQTEATDLIVLSASGLRVACRVRHPGYAMKYGREVTITCRRESGAPCEWDKMILGDWGDWFCYTHATDESAIQGELRPAFIVDLARSRKWIRRHHGLMRGPNRDPVGQRCWFYAISIDAMITKLGPDCLVAARWPLPMADVA